MSWDEVQVEAVLEDAVDVGRVSPMEEQHLSHFLLSVHLPSRRELELLDLILLQCFWVADVFY